MKGSRISDIKALIIDDDPLVLSALRAYSKEASHTTVIDGASDGYKVLDTTARGGVGVALTDIHMPNMDGIELLERIKKMENPPKFIAIILFGTDRTASKILNLGGNDYILKTTRPESVIGTIEDVSQDDTVISSISVTRLIEALPSRNISSYKIAQTEQKIPGLICCSKLNRDIAEEPGKSPDTIKKYLSSIFNKFGATPRLNLALKAVDAGFQPSVSAAAK